MKENKKNWIALGIVGFLLLFTFGFYIKNLHFQFLMDGIQEMEKYNTSFYIRGGITLLLVGLAVWIASHGKKENLHKIYLLVGLLLGACYLIVMPLFVQSDEVAHYLRAYEMSNGHFVASYVDGQRASLFSKSVYDTIYTDLSKLPEYKTYEDMKSISTIENSDEEVVLSNSAGNYSFINYIPHILGIWVSKLFGGNPYVCGILGRIFSVIFCVCLASLGIKWLPEGKFFAFTCLLSPVFLSYSASFSADATTIVYVFLLFSFILKKRKEKKVLNKWDVGILTLLTMATSLAKIAYMPLIIFIFFLPKECFKNRKMEYLCKGLLVVLGASFNFGWRELLSLAAAHYQTVSTESAVATNAWIYTQPIRFMMVLLNTLFVNGYDYLINIFGGEFLCHMQVVPFALISFILLLINALAYFTEEKNKEGTWWQCLFVFMVFAFVSVLILIAMYFASTYEGSPIVIGVQGRYFLPLLFTFCFLKMTKPISISKKYLTYANLICNYFILLDMVLTFLY